MVYLASEHQLPLLTITDHDGVEGCLKFVDQHPDIPLLPGIEMTCDEGDFLFFSLNFDRLLPLQEKGLWSISDFQRADDVVIIWAHPLTRKFNEEDGPFSKEKNLRKVMDSIDGIEVLNGNVMTRVAIRQEPESYPDRMRALADEFGKAQTGGSDSHNFYSFLSCWTEVPDELATPEGVIEAIKQRLTVPCLDDEYYKKITKVVYKK